MSDLLNNTFKADEHTMDMNYTIKTFLDLSNQPAGYYYFNMENNYNYTRNWFNYKKFHNINNETLIEEVVQYSSPDLIADSLDLTKTYTLPSTSLNVSWASRIQTENNNTTAGFSSADSNGNTYVLVNYTTSSVAYNQDNTIGVTKVSPSGQCSSITKYNTSGVVQWSSRIRSSTVGQSTTSLYMTVGTSGMVYIIGTCTSNTIIFEETTGLSSFTLNLNGNTYLVAYNSDGTPVWVTYFSPIAKPCLCVSTNTDNIYVISEPETGTNAPRVYYDSVKIVPVPLLALGEQIIIGTTQLISVQRSSGGVATLTFNKPVATLGKNGLNIGTKFCLLGLTNDFDSFNTISGTITAISGNTISYLNAVGTIPYVNTASSGKPIVTIVDINAGIQIACFAASSGLFRWATYVSGSTLTFADFINTPLLNQTNRFATTDPSGNLYITGNYTDIYSIKKPINTDQLIIYDESINIPPTATPLYWEIYEDDRNWVGIDCWPDGSAYFAIVSEGYIYVGTNYGKIWTERATIQNWSSIVVGTGGIVATAYESLIYYSTALDFGVNWLVCNGEGAVAKKWVAIDGSEDSTKLVAVAEDDTIYYAIGGVASPWVASNAPTAKWADVAYDQVANRFIALIKNGQAYQSINNGISWSVIAGSPSVNWKAITGTRTSVANPTYRFYAVVNNGVIYGITSSNTFVILDTNVRNYVTIANTGYQTGKGLIYAAVEDGALYQSIAGYDSTWNPITVPRNWSSICTTRSTNVFTTAAVVNGGRIYIARDVYPKSQTFILKYNLDGNIQWINYIRSDELESTNAGLAIACQDNGNIVVSGYMENSSNKSFFSPTDYTTPIKVISTNYDSPRYIVSYSNLGIPLWAVPLSISSSTTYGRFSSIDIDALGNIYCIGYGENIKLYNPDKQLIFQYNSSNNTTFLVKYYTNGHVQSFTRMTNAYGSSIKIIGGDIYLSGWRITPTSMDLYNSPGNVIGTTEPFTNNGVFISKYSSNTTSSFVVPPVEYNTSFVPLLTIGGSKRKNINGFVSDGAIELWGGQTGLLPSAITIADANAGVISYLGHEPGYTIPLENGIQISSPIDYKYLTVVITENSLPSNDPQPVTLGTIPYGYVPIFIVFPNDTIALQFNNSTNDNINLILYGIGSSSNVYPTGITAGDSIRILVYSTNSVQYVSLTIKTIIPLGIVFEENTRSLCNILGTTTTATATLLFANSICYLPVFYKPHLIQSGTLNLTLSLYAKEQS